MGDAELIIRLNKELDGIKYGEIQGEGAFENVVSHLLNMEGGREVLEEKVARYGFNYLQGGPRVILKE